MARLTGDNRDARFAGDDAPHETPSSDTRLRGLTFAAAALLALLPVHVRARVLSRRAARSGPCPKPARCLTTATDGWYGAAAISSPRPMPYRAGGQRSVEALCRQQSGLRRLPPRGRNEKIRTSDLRALRRIPALQRARRRRDHHRAAREFLHDAQPERSRHADDAPEMQALVAYIKFLSTGVPPGERIPGLGAETFLNLTAPPIRCAAAPSMSRSARAVTTPTDRAFGGACRPLISATSCRRCGSGFLQRRRRHEPSDHGGEFRPFQHAAGGGLRQSGAPAGRCLGRRGLCGVAAAAQQTRTRKGFSGPRTEAVDTPYGPISTASVQRSTNTARSRQSARRSPG